MRHAPKIQGYGKQGEGIGTTKSRPQSLQCQLVSRPKSKRGFRGPTLDFGESPSLCDSQTSFPVGRKMADFGGTPLHHRRRRQIWVGGRRLMLSRRHGAPNRL
ncbi:hypothetical protein CR513_08565, partial [Mucuna pruriens]